MIRKKPGRPRLTARTSDKRILLLGANRSNVPAIRAARQAGFFTMVVDPHADSPGFAEADVAIQLDVRDCEAVVAELKRHGGVDGILSMSEVGVRSAARMCIRLGLPTISEAAAANATSKGAMRRLWASTGFSPEFEIAETESEARRASERLGIPLVFKPDRSFGGSRGVMRVDDLCQVSEAFHFARNGGLPDTSIVIERCITGTEHSCEVLIWEGQCHVLCIGEKVKSPAPYRVDVSVQYPACLSPEQERLVEQACETAIRALGLIRGVAHVEFAMTSSGPMLFELGARCGGGHTPLIAHAVSGVDEFLAVCRMACGMHPGNVRPAERRGADYRFLIFPPGEVAAIRLPPELLGHANLIDAGIIVGPGQRILPLRTTEHRSGFVVTRGRTREEAIGAADWASSQIRVEYCDGSSSCALGVNTLAEVRA